MAQYVYRGRKPIRDMRLVRQDEPPQPVIVEPQPVPAEPEPEVAPDYSLMLKADLVDLALALGIDATGTKAQIIARLSDA
jgi:hypothetical protein